MQTILVTGGFGYLGGRLAGHLVSAGHNIRITTRRDRRDWPAWAADADVRQINPATSDVLDEVVEGVGAVLHLAGSNEIVAAADPPQALIDTGNGTARLLSAAIKAGVQRFVYYSTWHVYAAPLVGKIDERTVARPAHPYAIVHRAAEDFVLAAHDRNDIAGIVLRISNGFGVPRDIAIDRWKLIVNDLCRQAVTLGTLSLQTPGLQKRDFIPISDIATATSHVLALQRAQLADGLFNIGGRSCLTVRSLAERIARRIEPVLGFRAPLTIPSAAGAAEAHDIDYRIDKIVATGWSPAADIDGEIDATLRFCSREFGAGQL